MRIVLLIVVLIVGCGEVKEPEVITIHYNEPGDRSSLGSGSVQDAGGTGSTPLDAQAAPAGVDAGAKPCKRDLGCFCGGHVDCDSGACLVQNGEGRCVDPCAHKEALDEICDGRDNDCSGEADDGACDDGNACTEDLCDKVTGCGHEVTVGPCDDGNPCTQGEMCQLNVCKGGQAKVCDDGNVCTAGVCDPKSGCQHKAKSGGCDDGNACTKADTCNGGVCKGVGKTCSDNNPCTLDGCDNKGGCNHKPKAGSCDDGNPCTTADACQGSACKGKTKTCNDNNPCTGDSCDAKGACVHQPKGGACSDGNKCTVDDTCKSGKCAGVLKFKGSKCDQCIDSKMTGPNCDMVATGVPNNSYCQPVASWSASSGKLEEQVVAITNQYRAKGYNCGGKYYGKTGPLTMNGALRCAARKHSKDMVQKNFFSHTNKSGESAGTRIKKAGYGSSWTGENIAGGNSSAAKTVLQWMKSSGHCKNIMNPSYKGIGVGYYKGGKYGHTWTQTFGNIK